MPHPALRPVTQRLSARGKFLFVEDEKYCIRGVTYGPFRPEADGCEYHTPEKVRADFALMAASGINTVRVYTIPPRWLLDIAGENGLRVLIGLPWEQHITFLDDKKRPDDIVRRVREGVRTCAGHPALLAFAVGNEIPAPIVRWHGHRKIEKFIRRLYDAVKAEDSQALVTYVNYPSTEYLDLPFVDFVCFNVYLESQERLSAYLARLQNVAGDKPLVMAEVGLDSLRNGDDKQSATMAWQIQTAFASGCAGLFVFAWTDEWFRGGHDILDWKFGLTTIERQPKPALAAVSRAMASTPFALERAWPRTSVVVCTHNGSATIRDTLEGLRKLQYPDFEVIVVDDGSTDDTAAIVRTYADAGIKLISTPPRGLSAARNAGLAAASGEIIAFIDDDAWPDPHWLMYLADAFQTTSHIGMGGPNIVPPTDGAFAQCVAHVPGGPTHVLVDDRLAEHIPGCNMAFRTQHLREIGGFDEQFRVAGDDVDICWRIQARGWTIGFAAAAMVWHHRRNSAGRFWKQQYHYGAAEAQLQRKWPRRYTPGGQIAWSGRIYDRGASFFASRRRIYHGTWGSAPFQSVYHMSSGFWSTIGLMPEWYLLVVVLGAGVLTGIWWHAMLWLLPALLAAITLPIAQAASGARRAAITEGAGTSARRSWWTILGLHLLQPAARLLGRLRFGLTPWRGTRHGGFALPWPRRMEVWRQTWTSCESQLEGIERELEAAGAVHARGGDFDRWDMEVRGGALGAARMRMTVEEHGSGRQMMRFSLWPCFSKGWLAVVLGLAVGAAVAGFCGHAIATWSMGILASIIGLRGVLESGQSLAAIRAAVKK